MKYLIFAAASMAIVNANYGNNYHEETKPQPNQCPKNSSFESWSGKCICWNGFVDDHYGGCKPVCPEGYQLDYLTQKYCEKICPWNHFYERKWDKCVPCP